MLGRIQTSSSHGLCKLSDQSLVRGFGRLGGRRPTLVVQNEGGDPPSVYLIGVLRSIMSDLGSEQAHNGK